MIKPRKQENIIEEYNPFKTYDNSELLMKNLEMIDSKNIRKKFKTTQDPITLAFETIEAMSLKKLAKDFIKESLIDLNDFINDLRK